MKKKFLQKFLREILPSGYRKWISRGKVLGRFTRIKKFKKKYNTNLWVNYRRIGESQSYRLVSVTAGREGPVLISFPEQGNRMRAEIHEENLMYLKCYCPEEEAFFVEDEISEKYSEVEMHLLDIFLSGGYINEKFGSADTDLFLEENNLEYLPRSVVEYLDKKNIIY